MQKAAVKKAKERLASARTSLTALESSRDYNSARRHWYNFLLSSNSVFSILEQGAKGFNKSAPWFGMRIERTR
jgi:hypothetical protein